MCDIPKATPGSLIANPLPPGPFSKVVLFLCAMWSRGRHDSLNSDPLNFGPTIGRGSMHWAGDAGHADPVHAMHKLVVEGLDRAEKKAR